MPQSKYELVREVSIIPQKQVPVKKDGIEVLMLSSLKAENKAKEKHISEQKKEIDKAINSAKENPLPKKTMQRFDREFSKQKEKNAFKTTVVLFFVAIIITSVLQPSIFFIKSGNELKLVNYSQRELRNVSVYSFNEFARGTTKPALFFERLDPKTSLPIINKETTVFVAFAERQMPAIGVYTLESNQNINNAENSNTYRTQKTPQEIYDELSGKNKAGDGNG